MICDLNRCGLEHVEDTEPTTPKEAHVLLHQPPLRLPRSAKRMPLASFPLGSEQTTTRTSLFVRERPRAQGTPLTTGEGLSQKQLLQLRQGLETSGVTREEDQGSQRLTNLPGLAPVPSEVLRHPPGLTWCQCSLQRLAEAAEAALACGTGTPCKGGLPLAFERLLAQLLGEESDFAPRSASEKSLLTQL